ncbi:GNAT family N-acetyltransferase [Tumebacillus algifaecis]|nr:GNAT family N-acetyltransferase [Tumebacillus algifaecis]
MEIVRAVGVDLEFVKDHGVESLQDGTMGTFDATGREERAKEIMNAVWERGGYAFVAKKDEQILGWIIAGLNVDYFSGEEVGFIYDLYAFVEHRGKGVGKALLQHAIADLRDKGYAEIRLNVFAGNPAQKLYESLGFAVRSSQMVLK